MSIDVVEQQVAKAYEEVRPRDGWTDAFEEVMHGDFSGVSTVIVIVVALMLLRPILALLPFIVSVWAIFMLVKFYG
jgi:hypothetical protein